MVSAAVAVSTGALVFNIMFMIVLVQSAGGLFAACNAMGFFEVSVAECEAMGSTFLKRAGDMEKDLWTAALVFPRVEACLFLGMGLGSVYAFFLLARGTKEVAVIHFMHAVWAVTVCLCHAQNAGLFGMTPEPNVLSGAKLAPFVVMTGVQAVLYWSAFFLTFGKEPPKLKKK